MPSEDSKTVKKEEFEDDDDDDRSLGSILRDKNKKKPASATKLPKPLDSSQKKPISKPVKKMETPISDSDDDKPILKRSATKDDKSKTKSKKKEEVKKKVEVVEVKKRERKVYDLPGQKREPPEERDSLRIFYETLYEQVPDSEMAAIWMMESGLLPKDVAKKVFEKKQKKNQLQKVGSPMKAVSTKRDTNTKSVTAKKVTDSATKSSSKKNATTVTSVKTKKRKKGESSEEEDSGDDFVISKVVKKRKA